MGTTQHLHTINTNFTDIADSRINTVDTGITSDIMKTIRHLKYIELNVSDSSPFPNLTLASLVSA